MASRRRWVSRVRLRCAGGNDAGFTVVEVLVALGLMSFTAFAAAPLFLSSLMSAESQQQKQNAITLAQSALEHANAMPASELYLGRAASDSTALDAALGSGLAPGLGAVANLTTDPSAVAGSAQALIPLCTNGISLAAPVAGIGCGSGATPSSAPGTNYLVRTAIDACTRETAGNCDAPAATATALATTQTAWTTTSGHASLKDYRPALSLSPLTYLGHVMLRITVDVSWPKRAGTGCALDRRGDCHVTLNALRDDEADPTFIPFQPVITSLSPSRIARGSSQRLTLTGTDLEAGAVVQVASGGCSLSGAAVVNGTGTQITGITIGGGTSSGTCTLQVTNPDGGTTVTPAVTVT